MLLPELKSVASHFSLDNEETARLCAVKEIQHVDTIDSQVQVLKLPSELQTLSFSWMGVGKKAPNFYYVVPKHLDMLRNATLC